jgi:hypothetical protein
MSHRRNGKVNLSSQVPLQKSIYMVESMTKGGEKILPYAKNTHNILEKRP